MRDPAALVTGVLTWSGWSAGDAVVFDAIRHVEALHALKEVVSPALVLHVGLFVPDNTRLGRLRSRGESPAQVANVDAHSTEAQVPELVNEADLVFNTEEAPPHAIVASIVSMLLN